MRTLRDIRNVGDAQQRIAGRLDPHEARGLRQRGVHGFHIAEVHELDVELAATLPRREQTHRAAVAVVRHDDARTDGEKMADERDRAHAGAGDDRARAALEVGECLGQQIARRIARTAVVVFTFVTEAAKRIGRRKVQRWHHGAGHVTAFEARAHGAGVQGQRGRHPFTLSCSICWRKHVGEDRREPPVLLEESVVAVHRRDLVQLGVRQTRDHRAHVRERHELVLAHRDRGHGREDASRVHAMQIDGFGQAHE